MSLHSIEIKHINIIKFNTIQRSKKGHTALHWKDQMQIEVAYLSSKVIFGQSIFQVDRLRLNRFENMELTQTAENLLFVPFGVFLIFFFFSIVVWITTILNVEKMVIKRD